MSIFSDVLAFMRIGHPENIKDSPADPISSTYSLCRTLIKEEVGETLDAMDDSDIVEVADGIADSIYVLVYTAHCYGIPIEEIWDEVQRTNMSKFPDGKVLRRESDGKIQKPEGWQPPNIRAILDAHGFKG